jgi:hypothetical protein
MSAFNFKLNNFSCDESGKLFQTLQDLGVNDTLGMFEDDIDATITFTRTDRNFVEAGFNYKELCVYSMPFLLLNGKIRKSCFESLKDFLENCLRFSIFLRNEKLMKEVDSSSIIKLDDFDGFESLDLFFDEDVEAGCIEQESVV